jgi:hypothetical protein
MTAEIRRLVEHWREDANTTPGDTLYHRTLISTLRRCADQLDAALLASPDARHAAAPSGYNCSDCTIDGEACPACYAAWWKQRHPNHISLPAPTPSLQRYWMGGETPTPDPTGEWVRYADVEAALLAAPAVQPEEENDDDHARGPSGATASATGSPRSPQREIGHRICGDRHDRWVCNREDGHEGPHAATVGPQWA